MKTGADSRLLDDSVQDLVWPDSVQALGGIALLALPTGLFGVALFRFVVLPSAVPERGSPC